MREIKTDSPFEFPVLIVASITFVYLRAVTLRRVPLHNLDEQRFRNNMIGTPTFSLGL